MAERTSGAITRPGSGTPSSASMPTDWVTIAAENSDAEFPGSHAPLESGDAPEGFSVKGNRNSMKYHVPGSRWYSGTTAEIWFDSPANAEAAGFQPAGGAAAQKISE